MLRSTHAFFRSMSYLLVLSMAMLHLPVHAAMVGTGTVLNGAAAEDARAQLHNLLERAEVQEALLAQGVDPQEARARVDSLTDAEVQRIAGHLDELPAGGSVLGVVVFIFVLLLVTDILGLTSVFPFVNR